MERKHTSKKTYDCFLGSFFFSASVCLLTVLHCTGHFQVSIANKEEGEGRAKSWKNKNFVICTQTQSSFSDIERKSLANFNQHILDVDANVQDKKTMSSRLQVLLPKGSIKKHNKSPTVHSKSEIDTFFPSGNTSCYNREKENQIISENRPSALFHDKHCHNFNQKLSTNYSEMKNSLSMQYTKLRSFTKNKFINHAFYGETLNFIDRLGSKRRPDKNLTNNWTKRRLMQFEFYINPVGNNTNSFNEEKYQVNRNFNKNVPPLNYNYQEKFSPEVDRRSTTNKMKKNRVIRQINSWGYPLRIWNWPIYQFPTTKDIRLNYLFQNKMSMYRFQPISQDPPFALRDVQISPFGDNWFSRITPNNFMKALNYRINSDTANKLLQSRNGMPSFGNVNQLGGECFIYQLMCLWLTEMKEYNSFGNCQCLMQKQPSIPIFIPPIVFTITPPQIPTIVFTWWFTEITTPPCVRYPTPSCITNPHFSPGSTSCTMAVSRWATTCITVTTDADMKSMKTRAHITTTPRGDLATTKCETTISHFLTTCFTIEVTTCTVTKPSVPCDLTTELTHCLTTAPGHETDCSETGCDYHRITKKYRTSHHTHSHHQD